MMRFPLTLFGLAIIAAGMVADHDRRIVSIAQQQARTIEQQQHEIERLLHLQSDGPAWHP